MNNEQQPNKGIPSASEMSHYGGVPYTPPERTECASMEREIAPLSSAGRTWRIVLAVVLIALAVMNIVRFVLLIASVDAAGVGSPVAGLVGSAVLALLFLAYPVLLFVRMRRSAQ